MEGNVTATLEVERSPSRGSGRGVHHVGKVARPPGSNIECKLSCKNQRALLLAI